MPKNQKTYFHELNEVLRSQPRAIPSLLIDLDVLDKNMDVFKSQLTENAVPRIVVKSLPSPKLVSYIAERLQTNRYMVFHQPFLSDLARHLTSDADILLGKPMPVKTAQYFYSTFSAADASFDPYRQVQWLIDTKDRALQYLDLAKELGNPLRLNLEIDVGLHRGGFQGMHELEEVLNLCQQNKDWIIFSGYMGYDPHIVKIPRILQSRRTSMTKSNTLYHQYIDLLKEKYPDLWHDKLTFNGAGSPTITLHNNTLSPLNDIAAGSCFMKPTTFDIDTLSEYRPACFIATPVLKKLIGTTIPGIEKFRGLLNILDRKNAQSYFIYGGFWKADYVFPEKLKDNKLYGLSTNQSMVNAPQSSSLEVDDFVFLRPHQSEHVFLQFGKLVILRDRTIIDQWDIMKWE